jgi:hypothetical protein
MGCSMASPKLTPSEKMTRRGFIHFETSGVLARTTDARKLTPEQIVASVEIAGMGATVASHIRSRVRDDHKTAQGPFPGYKGSWSVSVIPEYKREVGASKGWFQSRSRMASEVGKGLFSMSGGMWAGLQARSSKQGREVRIDFRESSVAQHGVVAREVTITKGKRRGEKKNQRASPRVKNSHKAGAIFSRAGINVVQPSFDENLAMADAVSNRIGLKMAAAMDADSTQIKNTGGAQVTLVRALNHYWSK